jgi:hypothetical protein
MLVIKIRRTLTSDVQPIQFTVNSHNHTPIQHPKVSNETGGTYSARILAESLTTSRQTRSAVGRPTSK